MKHQYACTHCGTTITFSLYLKSRWNEATPDRCPRCGAVHAVLRGEVEPISPPMMPMDTGHGRVSAWMLPGTRPITPGRYECRFTDIEPRTIFLHWNGRRFEWDGEPVAMYTFLSWRGIWG